MTFQPRVLGFLQCMGLGVARYGSIQIYQRIVDGDHDVYNNGDMRRDFTYIDDIVEGIVRIQDIVPAKTTDWSVESGSPATSSYSYKVFNIHGSPVKLMDFVESLEGSLGIEAKKNFMPMQPVDVYATYAETKDLFDVTGYTPKSKCKKVFKL